MEKFDFVTMFKNFILIFVNIGCYTSYIVVAGDLLKKWDTPGIQHLVCAPAGMPLGSIHRQPLYALLITGGLGYSAGLALLSPSYKNNKVLDFCCFFGGVLLVLALWVSLDVMLPFSRLRNDEIEKLECDTNVVAVIRQTQDRMKVIPIYFSFQTMFNCLFLLTCFENKNPETKSPLKDILLSKESVEQKA